MTDAEITKRLAEAMGGEYNYLTDGFGHRYYDPETLSAKVPLKFIEDAIKCAEKISPDGAWTVWRIKIGEYRGRCGSMNMHSVADTHARALCLACVAELDRRQKSRDPIATERCPKCGDHFIVYENTHPRCSGCGYPFAELDRREIMEKTPGEILEAKSIRLKQHPDSWFVQCPACRYGNWVTTTVEKPPLSFSIPCVGCKRDMRFVGEGEYPYGHRYRVSVSLTGEKAAVKCDCGSGKAKDDTGHYPWCKTQREPSR